MVCVCALEIRYWHQATRVDYRKNKKNKYTIGQRISKAFLSRMMIERTTLLAGVTRAET